MSKKLLTVLSLIILAALSRLLPHLPNFTPLAAIAIFSGAYITNRYLSLFTPLLVMVLSDAMMGFNGWAFPEQTVAVYGTFLVISLMGRIIAKDPSVIGVGAVTLASSIFFFVTTNFATWLGGYFHQPPLYPMTSAGLIDCYISAIPFFSYTLLGDLFYNAVLFGGFYLLSINIPALSEEKNA